MKRWWILLGIVAVVVILVVMIPARAYSMILENYGTYLLATKGTIWYGSGEVSAAGKNIGRLEWSLQPKRVFAGKLAYRVSMQNQNIRLSGILNRGFTYTEFHGSTTLAQSLVNTILLPYEIQVQGEFEIKELSVRVNDKRQVKVLTGNIVWEGGTSRYRTNNETRIFEMPAVTGKLSQEENTAVLNTLDQERNIPLVNVRFQPESGLFEVALTQHMLELSKMPFESAADTSEIVVEVSRELY